MALRPLAAPGHALALAAAHAYTTCTVRRARPAPPGSAPMRAMTEWRRRLRKCGEFEGGKLMLFFGPLQNLPKDFIDINLAFSRPAWSPC